MIADHFQYWTIHLLIVTRFKCSFFDKYKCGYEVESYMSQLLLLGKFEYGGGPIFKVVLEC